MRRVGEYMESFHEILFANAHTHFTDPFALAEVLLSLLRMTEILRNFERERESEKAKRIFVEKERERDCVCVRMS